MLQNITFVNFSPFASAFAKIASRLTGLGPGRLGSPICRTAHERSAGELQGRYIGRDSECKVPSCVRARMEGLRQHPGSARVPLGAGGRAMLSRLARACEIEPEVCKFQRPVRAWACRLWVGSGAEAQGGHRGHD